MDRRALELTGGGRWQRGSGGEPLSLQGDTQLSITSIPPPFLVASALPIATGFLIPALAVAPRVWADHTFFRA